MRHDERCLCQLAGAWLTVSAWTRYGAYAKRTAYSVSNSMASLVLPSRVQSSPREVSPADILHSL